MRIVLQRVRSASVTIAGRQAGAIAHGYLVLLGIEKGDTAEVGGRLARKLATARLFADEAGKMNRSLTEVGGGALVVSQFTLFGTLEKGTRPDFHRAAPPGEAIVLYECFIGQLRAALGPGCPVACGEFGADMQVSLVNDGPVTLILDGKLPNPATAGA